MICDLHTHSYFSPDGHATLEEMVRAAREQAIGYYGVSEHFDCDALSPAHFEAGGGPFPTTDPARYFPHARALQEKETDGTFCMLVGGEFGFCPDPAVQAHLCSIQREFAPDFVINSVHIIDGADVYFAPFFEGKTREEAYERYLYRVQESLGAQYAYDIVGHIGYPSRNAPFGHREMTYEQFPRLFDAILQEIIDRGKILEVNGSTAGLHAPFLPDVSVLKRYFALGGRAVSYGSDAHGPAFLCQNRGRAVEALKEIGFTHLTVPLRGEFITVPI